jgi:hypothetical protein
VCGCVGVQGCGADGLCEVQLEGMSLLAGCRRCAAAAAIPGGACSVRCPALSTAAPQVLSSCYVPQGAGEGSDLRSGGALPNRRPCGHYQRGTGVQRHAQQRACWSLACQLPAALYLSCNLQCSAASVLVSQIAMLGGQVGEDGEDGIAAAQPAGPAPKHPVAKGKPSKPMGVDEFMDKGVGGAQLPRKRWVLWQAWRAAMSRAMLVCLCWPTFCRSQKRTAAC